jgi:hypothetical protein
MKLSISEKHVPAINDLAVTLYPLFIYLHVIESHEVKDHNCEWY